MHSAWGGCWWAAWGNAWGQWTDELLIFPLQIYSSGSAAGRSTEPSTRPRKRRREEDEALLFGLVF
jgi:hypothetical protein